MGQEDEILLTCYNPGCPEKKFVESKNHEKACTYHPKMPFFHDGIKRWPCCKKSSCDFSTLLAYPGCIQGPHNPEKPAPVVQAPTKEEQEHEQREMEAQKGEGSLASCNLVLGRNVSRFLFSDAFSTFCDIFQNK